MTENGLPKKRCKLVKACHQPLYKEAVVERWDELKEADPFRDSSEESEAEDDEILIQIEAQERDPTRQSSPVCDQLRTGGTNTDAHPGEARHKVHSQASIEDSWSNSIPQNNNGPYRRHKIINYENFKTFGIGADNIARQPQREGLRPRVQRPVTYDKSHMGEIPEYAMVINRFFCFFCQLFIRFVFCAALKFFFLLVFWLY